MKTELSSSTRNLRQARNAKDFKTCSLSGFIIMRNEVLSLLDLFTAQSQSLQRIYTPIKDSLDIFLS